jgi:hypothetical protein
VKIFTSVSNFFTNNIDKNNDIEINASEIKSVNIKADCIVSTILNNFNIQITNIIIQAIFIFILFNLEAKYNNIVASNKYAIEIINGAVENSIAIEIENKLILIAKYE